MKKVIVVGAGPAGISCAIMLKHLGITPLLIEKNKIGGLLHNAYLVKNYLAINEISGTNLVKKFEKHLNDFDIKPIFTNLTQINYKKYFIIETDKKTLKSDFLVIATGTKPKKLNFKISPKVQKRIFYEVANFPSIKNKHIAIVGAGDCAFDYALTLGKKNQITILNRSAKPKCNDFLWNETKKNRKTKYLKNFEITKIDTQGKKIILNFQKSTKYDYLLVAIGRKPNFPLLTNRAKKSKNLYLVGDVKNGLYRQTAISVSDGIKTAMEIYGKIKR